MGILFIIIGGVIGYYISGSVTPENLQKKMLYAIGIPLIVFVFDIAVLAIIYDGNGYQVGSNSAITMFACITAMIVMLIKIRIKKDEVNVTDEIQDESNKNDHTTESYVISDISDSNSIEVIEENTELNINIEDPKENTELNVNVEVSDEKIEQSYKSYRSNNIETIIDSESNSEPTNQKVDDVINTSITNEENGDDKNKIYKYKNVFLSIGVFLVLSIVAGGIIYYICNKKTPEERYEIAYQLWEDDKCAECIAIMEELVKDDYAKAKFFLGDIYKSGTFVNKDTNKALSLLTEACEANDTSAMVSLAQYYFKEEGDPNKSLELLQKAYDLGSKNAVEGFVHVYYDEKCKDSKNNARDPEKAKYYAEIGAKQGNGVSCFTLGNIYSSNEIGEIDYNKAFYWWKKGLDLGNEHCACNLGWMYYFGNGVEENNEKAYNYFRQALSLNSDNNYALYYIGEMFEKGFWIEANEDSAIVYYNKSADLGNDNAQSKIAELLK